jgi:outer membrane immunogenic protein
MRLKLLAATIAASVVAGSAAAADLPSRVETPVYIPPVLSWTGFYLGVNGGGAWGFTGWNFPTNGESASHDMGGGFVGGTVGANYQFSNRLVLGLEGDADFARVNGQTVCPNAFYSCASHVDFLASARGRVGYVFDRALLYATGGVGFEQFGVAAKVNNGNTVNGLTVFGPPMQTNVGWVLGVGAEYALTDNWSIKAEYLHYDFGARNYVTTIETTSTSKSVRDYIETVKIGVNYKFGGYDTPASLSHANVGDLPAGRMQSSFLASPPIFSWTGVYVGINGGGAWGFTGWTFPFIGTNASHDSAGGFVGGAVGGNYQFSNRVVLGFEGDADWARVKGGTDCPNTNFNCGSQIGLLASARGRVGYAFDRVLLYTTGGLGIEQFQVFADLNNGSTFNGVNAFQAPTQTNIGWVLGFGAEYAITGNWSVKAEYLHYDFGTHSYVTMPGDVHDTVAARNYVETVKVGVNYKFGGVDTPVVAKY